MDVVTHGLSGAVVGAAFGAAVPAYATELTLLGMVAGMLPDLDFLAELKGKEAAWKLHRIVLHGIAPAFLLGTLLVIVTGLWLPVTLMIVTLTVFAAISVHLFLDVLTSFGTCLFYPFSKFRVSVKSHFIVDPVVLLICIYALMAAQPVAGLLALLGYVVFSWCLKAAALQFVTTRLPAGVDYSSITLEPALLAPFRWLVILKTDDGYVFAPLDFFSLKPWHHVAKGNERLLPLALQSGLLKAVLDTFEFPVLRRTEVEGKSLFILEDVKWWTERPFRPLAFQALIVTDEHDQPVLHDIRQGSFFVRESADHAFLQPPQAYQPPAGWP